MKQKKSMDQDSETPSPSSRPKLVRRNAAKNFDYYPSSLPSNYVSSNMTSTSSASRTRSLDLNLSFDRSLQIKGNDGQLSQVCESLGLSGPEDFEIPKAVWEMYRASSESIQKPKDILWDDNEIAHSLSLDALKDTVDLSPEEMKTAEVDAVLDVPVTSFNSFASNGIVGYRPPVLTLPATAPLVIVDECPPQNMAEESEPKNVEADLYPIGPVRSARSVRSVRSVRSIRSSNIEHVAATNVNVAVVHRDAVAISESDNSSSASLELDSSSSSTDNSPIVRIKFSVTNWQKGKRLGQGSFGTVYEGISNSTGIFFAVKEVSLLQQGSQGKESILSLQQEIDIFSSVQHKNIVQYLGSTADDENLYIFLELVTKGSLANLIRIYDLQDSVVAAYTRQILSGLKYLHSRNIVHRDIKCANILVASSGTVKLADFGLAKTVKANDLRSCKGTALWMAPEVVNNKNQGYGTAADIWSLGCTVLELKTRQLPYHPLENMQALFRIGMGQPPPIPENLSADLKNFIKRCLQVNPGDRPSAAELLDDPFLKRYSSINPGIEFPATGGWTGI